MHGVKTIKELYAIGDNWRNRAHRLRVVWQDTNRDPKERTKAYIIWFELAQRILKIANVISQYHQRTYCHNFSIGGVFTGKPHEKAGLSLMNTDEQIINSSNTYKYLEEIKKRFIKNKSDGKR